MTDSPPNSESTRLTGSDMPADESHQRSRLPGSLKRDEGGSRAARVALKLKPYPTAAEAAVSTRPAVGAGALSARLLVLIGEESVSSFARRCDLPESVLRTYLKDGRMPPLDKALAIATAAGVSVDWLATGDGVRVAAEARASYGASPGRPGDGKASPLDDRLLEGILKTTLEGEGTQASPARLAALVTERYRRLVEGGDAGVPGG